jgi:hypothetical protein
LVAEADPYSRLEHATPATTDDNLLPFGFPAVERKKVTAAFDGGRLSSDGGVMLLSQAERRLGLAERLAAVIPDDRDASRVTHRLPDILRARIFAIACGYEDADDPRPAALRPGLQARLRTAPRQRKRSVLAAYRLALGERAVVARPHPPDEGDGRSLLRQLPRATSNSDAGH